MSQFVRVLDRNIKIEGRLLKTGRIDGEKYLFLDDPEAVVEGLKKCGTRVDLFTFMQGLPESAPKYRYPMEWDNFATLTISTFDAWWTKQVDAKTRNMVRKAEKKGVTLREVPFDDALVQGICDIYNETPIRQGKRFPHYGMNVEQIRNYAGTFLDQSVFIGAFFEEKLIGFIKMTTDETRTQAGLMHVVSMVSQKGNAPTNGLVAQAVRSCAERQIKYLVYSNFAYGKKHHDSLSAFKKNNGFQRVEIPRYYVPLTPLGRAAFRLRLHHKLSDRVPESLMSKLRDFRTAWYGRKFQSSTEAI